MALFSQRLGEADAVALDDDVDIGIANLKQQVADKAAGNIGVAALLGGGFPDFPEQDGDGLGEDLSHDAAEITRPFDGRPFVTAQQIR